jgi:hypothetical protein
MTCVLVIIILWQCRMRSGKCSCCVVMVMRSGTMIDHIVADQDAVSSHDKLSLNI